MDYRFPALAGIAERWGRSVFHGPFCHGWEVRNRPLGVLDRGASGVHRALRLRVWRDDATLLADGPAALEVDARFPTTVPGLFAAGDVSVRMPSAANAVAAGAAAMVVQDLVAEAHGLAPIRG